MLHYTQQLPPADLRDWVRLVWTLSIDASAPGEAEPVIPDGYAELIFNIGDPFEHRASSDAGFRVQPAAIINGQLCSAVSLRSQGEVRLVGVRLQPWALGALINMPAYLLTDCWLPVDTISPHLMPDLRDHLINRQATESVLDIVVRHLRLLIARRRVPDQRLRSVVQQVGNAEVSATVGGIGRKLGLSERSVQRLFANEVGVSAKQYGKVLRVQRAVRLRRSHGEVTWARAALDAGYYDQSHFNKDFRAVVGCAPSALIVEPESFTDAFMTDAGSDWQSLSSARRAANIHAV